MTNPFADWIDIFKAGRRTDSAGVTRDFSESDLDAIVANHSAADAAPAVVGHPKTNDPAFGWTAALRRVGDRLQAKFDKVAPEFSAAVAAGHYAKRSVRIAPDNKGGWRLLHVGWLGAAPPAVDGLAALNYSAPADAIDFEVADFRKSALGALLSRLMEEKSVSTADLADAAGISESTVSQILRGEIDNPPEERIKGFASALGVSVETIKETLSNPDFAMPDSFTPNALARFFRRFREWTLDRFSLDVADRLIPQSDIDALAEQSRTLAAEAIEQPDSSGLPSFSRHIPKPGDTPVTDTAEIQERLNAAETERDQLRQQNAEFALATRRSAAQQVINQAIDDCRLSPAQAAGMADFMANLNAEAEMDFSQGDGRAPVRKTPADFFASFVAQLPVQPELQKLQSEQAAAGQRGTAVQFAAPAGSTVDAERAELHAKALEYQRANKCDFITAVKAVEVSA